MNNILHLRSEFFQNGSDVLEDDGGLLAIIIGYSFNEFTGGGICSPLSGYISKRYVWRDDGDIGEETAVWW